MADADERRTSCLYCGEELWGWDERGGVCRSCAGAELDEAADDWAAYHAGVGPPYDDDEEGNPNA